jgi:predicted MPP superfamily phosphohydrolase
MDERRNLLYYLGSKMLRGIELQNIVRNIRSKTWRILSAILLPIFLFIWIPSISHANMSADLAFQIEQASPPAQVPDTGLFSGGTCDSSSVGQRKGTFSIIWLSDTQAMAYGYPEALTCMGSWIRNSYQKHHVRYVIQTGDAVDNGFKAKQWESFDRCYSQFRDLIPYFGIAGNHDLGVKLQDYSAYLARPNVRAIPHAYSFEAGKGAYATFYAKGVSFLLIGAGWGAEEASAHWMNTILRQHPDSVAILLFHSYINADGSYTRIGQKMFDEVVQKNPNVRLVLSGHVRGTGAHFEEIDDTGDGISDRKVTALIYNYQHYGQNCGQLRILTFNTSRRSITVLTYSPVTEKHYVDDYFRETIFTIEHAY